MLKETCKEKQPTLYLFLPFLDANSWGLGMFEVDAVPNPLDCVTKVAGFTVTSMVLPLSKAHVWLCTQEANFFYFVWCHLAMHSWSSFLLFGVMPMQNWISCSDLCMRWAFSESATCLPIGTTCKTMGAQYWPSPTPCSPIGSSCTITSNN